MKTQLETLKNRVGALKGAAKAVVERRIAELEANELDPSIKALTLIELIEQSSTLVEELEISIASLDDRLAIVLPTKNVDAGTISSTMDVPVALSRVTDINRALKVAINRINTIIEQIRL